MLTTVYLVEGTVEITVIDLAFGNLNQGFVHYLFCTALLQTLFEREDTLFLISFSLQHQPFYIVYLPIYLLFIDQFL
jgi:hypothetical protein